MTKRSTHTRSTPKGKSKSASAHFSACLKSFIGHLEGSGKARHTISAYRLDLENFAGFLNESKSLKAPLELRSVVRRDLERYHDWLKHSGQKANTRRRKLMTVRKLMHYLTARKKIDLDIGKKLPAPEKSERVPETVDLDLLRSALLKKPADSLLSRRNTALVAILADTGVGVAEASKLRWSEISFETGVIRVLGKSERELKISKATLGALVKLREDSPEDELCFIGFNRHGPMRVGKRALGITPRGIELVIKTLAESLGFSGVTPRTLRHSAVVEWYRSGVDVKEIQKRLGLKTDYAFRIYAPIFSGITAKSKLEATSSE